jgi:hypothetical protein
MVININLLLFWCGPRSPKNVFMRPAKPRMSLMRPVSQFEFETPVLTETCHPCRSVPIQLDHFCGPHISQIANKQFRFCSKFLDLYASVYGRIISQKNNEIKSHTVTVTYK